MFRNIGRKLAAHAILLIQIGEAMAWSTSCYDDPIEDQRVCVVGDREIAVVRITGLDCFVTVGDGDSLYPGSTIVLRIDNHEPLIWPENA